MTALMTEPRARVPREIQRNGGRTIYVPRLGTPERALIIAGSGIVGTRVGDRLVIDYEGNKFNAPQYATYEARVWGAYWRHTEFYPTTARSWVRPGTMKAVGTIDPDTETIEIDHPDVVEEWCA